VRPGGRVAITDAVEHLVRMDAHRTSRHMDPGILRLRPTGPIRRRDPRIPVKHPIHDLGRGRQDPNLRRLGASPALTLPADPTSAAP
jgi:hypothetical protein